MCRNHKHQHLYIYQFLFCNSPENLDIHPRTKMTDLRYKLTLDYYIGHPHLVCLWRAEHHRRWIFSPGSFSNLWLGNKNICNSLGWLGVGRFSHQYFWGFLCYWTPVVPCRGGCWCPHLQWGPTSGNTQRRTQSWNSSDLNTPTCHHHYRIGGTMQCKAEGKTNLGFSSVFAFSCIATQSFGSKGGFNKYWTIFHL